MAQTKRGKAADKRKTAKKVLAPTKANVAKWKKNPGRMDIKGVDTKKPIGKAVTIAKKKKAGLAKVKTKQGKSINTIKTKIVVGQKPKEEIRKMNINEAQKIESERTLKDIMKYKATGGDKRGADEVIAQMSNSELMAHYTVRENELRKSITETGRASSIFTRRIERIKSEMNKRGMVV